MFGHRFFAARYFGSRYWGPAGSITPPEPTPTVETPTYGWLNWRNIGRQQAKDEIRRERERLGIVPKQAKKIEKVADDLSDEITAYEPSAIEAQIRASAAFNALMADLARKDMERRAQIAEFAANLILLQILRDLEDEEAAIMTLVMEM